jgi:hypothetical protein
MEGCTYPQSTIITKWPNQITTRLNIDHRMALSKKKPNNTNKVRHTWTPILDQPNTLPDDWIMTLEVLVGITLSRPLPTLGKPDSLRSPTPPAKAGRA